MARTMAIACGMSLTLAAISPRPASGNQSSDLTGGRQVFTQVAAKLEQDAAERPTAEDVLAELQKKRPLNEVIPPASAAARGPAKVARRILPDGSSLIDRRGRLEYRPPWWVFLDESESVEQPLKLLAGAILEKMVRTTIGTDASVSFIVSGELTVYRGENYFLPRVAMRATATAPAVNNQSERVDSTLSADATADEVFEALSQERPRQEILPPKDPTPGDRPVGAPSAGHPAIPDGFPLINRPGRIVRDGLLWTFVFESDHPDHPEPPMKLLPNLNVELMVTAAERDSGGLVFVVSGEVTAFGAENFLLARVAMRRIALGNLRK